MEHITLAQYWDMLNAHDWYYEMSDDNRTWAKGQQEAKELADISLISPYYDKLLKDFAAHHFSGPPWDNERIPKPTRPREL